MTLKGGPYATIDEAVAARIKELHKKYPRLGHRGLLTALRDMKLDVDSSELKTFMSESRIMAEKPSRPRQLKGIPTHLIGGVPPSDPGLGGT